MCVLLLLEHLELLKLTSQLLIIWNRSRACALLDGFSSKGGTDTSHGVALCSSNIKPQSHLLVLLEDLLVHLQYHHGPRRPLVQHPLPSMSARPPRPPAICLSCVVRANRQRLLYYCKIESQERQSSRNDLWQIANSRAFHNLRHGQGRGHPSRSVPPTYSTSSAFTSHQT